MITLIQAIVLMTMLGGTGERLDWSQQTKSRLLKIEGVKQVFGVFGRYDIIAQVEAEDMESLTGLIADKIRSVPGVQTSETLTIIF